ncbi:LUD domain-containing protein [Salinirubellus sp. GCM10025818]|uniref:LUD domain-containing protein n=1 Tax=Salinirubellus TaxID=2162630 RepID=UPI0030D52FC1
MSGLVETFEASLDDLDVTRTRTDPDGLDDALRDAVVEPVVGAPLPFEEQGLSLPDWVPVHPTADELNEARTGVTGAGGGIAEYGTLIVQSRPGGDEPVSLYPERHVAVVRATDLVPGVTEALEFLGEEFATGRDSAVFATGMSATGDMGELVRGVHGPREVHVVVVETDSESGVGNRAETEEVES